MKLPRIIVRSYTDNFYLIRTVDGVATRYAIENSSVPTAVRYANLAPGRKEGWSFESFGARGYSKIQQGH